MNSNKIWFGVFYFLILGNVITLVIGEFYWFVLFFTVLIFTSLVRIMWHTSGFFASQLDSIFGNKIDVEMDFEDLKKFKKK